MAEEAPAPAPETEVPEPEAPEVEEDPTLAYKEWKKRAIAKGKAVKAHRAAAEAPPQEAVKRYEVKKIAKDKAHLQDLLLKNYNTKNETDYDYQTFFQGVEKGDVPDALAWFLRSASQRKSTSACPQGTPASTPCFT